MFRQWTGLPGACFRCGAPVFLRQHVCVTCGADARRAIRPRLIPVRHEGRTHRIAVARQAAGATGAARLAA